MLEVRNALTLLLDAVAPLAAVEVSLDDALARALAETVVADRDFPPTDRSAMDGFAVRAVDCGEAGRSLTVAGEVRAGQDPGPIVVGVGEAVHIFTGAVIPRGADAVVMVEVTEEDTRARTVLVKERVEPGQNIRRRGEDVRAGAPVCEPGTIVRPAEIAALAAVGRTPIRVVRAASVAVISTGDEVVDVAVVPAAHQVRNSNARMLRAQLREIGADVRELGIAGDDRVTLIERDFAAVPEGERGLYDAVVSNPPYIPDVEWRGLQPEVRDHEPRLALVPGPTGNEAYAAVVRSARTMLRPNGILALELGWTSEAAVLGLVAAEGFRELAVRPDLQGIARVLTARN